MKPSDKTEFGEVIGVMAVTYRQEATTPFLRAYWLGLSDLTMDQIRRGTTRALQTLKFMPTPAEIREMSGELNKADRAAHAWSEFERAVVAHGGYKSVTFDDPLINATVRALGGWMRCCNLPCEEFDKWLRKDFIGHYTAFCSQLPGDDAMRPLVGSHCKENGILGHDHRSNRVVQIGTSVKPLIDPPEKRECLPGGQLAKQIADSRRVT